MANNELAGDYSSVLSPIDEHPEGKNLLSMYQFSPDDIELYIRQAYAAEYLLTDTKYRGIDLLPHHVLKAVMRQESTRTGGSMTTAMARLGGSAELISGMKGSAEAKGESVADSWVAFATQADIIGTRTREEYGPHYAASAIDAAFQTGQLFFNVPVVNLGDGRNEHPTQTLGDLFTIRKRYGSLDDLTLTIVGDHERYRPHHSLMIGAYLMNMSVVAVQSDVAEVPPEYVELLGDNLTITEDLDEAMKQTDVLYMGRNPDEYTEDDEAEKQRSQKLAEVYRTWEVNKSRLRQMSKESIVLHPRPRRNELNPDVDNDFRMRDVQQMANMTPMRMAIIALHLGFSIPLE